MNGDDDGLRCRYMRARTSAHVEQCGDEEPIPAPFVVTIERFDGGEHRLFISTVQKLGALVRELQPEQFLLKVARTDDGEWMRDALEAVVNGTGAQSTLH